MTKAEFIEQVKSGKSLITSNCVYIRRQTDSVGGYYMVVSYDKMKLLDRLGILSINLLPEELRKHVKG